MHFLNKIISTPSLVQRKLQRLWMLKGNVWIVYKKNQKKQRGLLLKNVMSAN